MKKSYKKVIKIVVNVILWLFVAFAVMMTTLALAAQSHAGIPAIGGKCFLTVASDSMVPTFKTNDLLICRIVSDSEKTNLKKGDVISFYADLNKDGNMEINTHRIEEVNTNSEGKTISYTTKGDNWVTDKDPVYCTYVISVWEGKKMVGVGGFISMIQKPKGFLLLIVLPLVLLFFYEGFLFVKTVISVKNGGKRQITKEDEEMIKKRAIEEYLLAQAEKESKAAESVSKDDVAESTDKKEE